MSVVEKVTGALSDAANRVATSIPDSLTSNPPPTAARQDSLKQPIGEPAEGEKDQHPLLSPHDEVAKEKLEKLMGARPDRKELVDKNILKNSNVAPSLQAKQAELERSQLEDILENKLQARPSPDELVKEGILQKDEAPEV